MAAAPSGEVLRRLRAVTPPRPVLDRERESRLTDRQREVLDELERMFVDGFADLTMAEIAARTNCSLRTLYGLAPSRDELVLAVVDRNLWRVGRSARDAIAAEMAPLDAVRAYLETASIAVSGITGPFARDLAAMPAAQRLWLDHSTYLVAVTESLLDLAVEQGEIADVDTAAVAQVMAGLGVMLSRAEVLPTLRTSPKEAADAVLEIILRGLQTPVRPVRGDHRRSTEP
jgi:AcrR family transcriptional regulator